MSHLRIVALLAVVTSLALAGVATAARISGGTTTVTISAAASQVLAANHLALAPLTPATASGSTLTFPIAGGRLNARNLGFVTHRGGFSISNGTSTVRLRHLTITATRAGVSLFALMPGRAARRCVRTARRGLRCATVTFSRVARVAHVTGVTVSNGVATGTAHLTAVSAAAINGLAAKQVVSAGAPFATITVTPAASVPQP